MKVTPHPGEIKHLLCMYHPFSVRIMPQCTGKIYRYVLFYVISGWQMNTKMYFKIGEIISTCVSINECSVFSKNNTGNTWK